MEPVNSTTRLSASSVIRDAPRPDLDFELPEADGFTSVAPLVSLERMISGSRQMRAWFPAGIPTAEERWRAKSDVEFCL